MKKIATFIPTESRYFVHLIIVVVIAVAGTIIKTAGDDVDHCDS
jgi:hypothetical protein